MPIRSSPFCMYACWHWEKLVVGSLVPRHPIISNARSGCLGMRLGSGLMCTINYIVAKCPGLAGTVLEFAPMSRLCPGLPDFAALSRNPVRLHKWRCGTSINSVYYRISVRISRCLVGVAVHNRPKVGVVHKFSHALYVHSFYFLLCPGLSAYKLGNYAIIHTYK